MINCGNSKYIKNSFHTVSKETYFHLFILFVTLNKTDINKINDKSSNMLVIVL